MRRKKHFAIDYVLQTYERAMRTSDKPIPAKKQEIEYNTICLINGKVMSISGSAIINNERGIHARPSSEIAKEALKYKSNITISFEGKSANAKDVLQLIILELFKGVKVDLCTSGDDEQIAFDSIKALLEKHFEFE